MMKDGLQDEMKQEEAEEGEVDENGLISSSKKVTLWTIVKVSKNTEVLITPTQ